MALPSVLGGSLRSTHTAAYRAFLRFLRQARTEAGLTQAAVAKALRKPQSYVSKCESGERRVDFTELEALATLYKKPLAFFVAERCTLHREMRKGCQRCDKSVLS